MTEQLKGGGKSCTTKIPNEKDLKEAREVIKFTVLSKIVTGSEHNIRKDNVLPKYKPMVDQLENSIASILHIAKQAYNHQQTTEEKFKELFKDMDK